MRAASCLKPIDDSLGKGIGAKAPAEVRGFAAVRQRTIVSLFQSLGRLLAPVIIALFVQVIEHHHGGHEQGERVGHVLAGDVRGAAVDRFEDRIVFADVRTGHHAKARRQGPPRDR